MSLLVMHEACRLLNGRRHLLQRTGDDGGEQELLLICGLRLDSKPVIAMDLNHGPDEWQPFCLIARRAGPNPQPQSLPRRNGLAVWRCNWCRMPNLTPWFPATRQPWIWQRSLPQWRRWSRHP